MKIGNWKLKITDFIKKNKREVIILALILIVGAFFRLYKISSYMTFLGDEGRDVIIVRKLLVEGHPPLIGPGTSIGNMYLGPLYYYFMAPGLLLTHFSPVGPAIQIAFLGIITIWMVWYIGREWFDKTTGLVAAGLYAISPIVIIYSRSSWNPNIMPFFALLSVYSVWRVWKKKEFKWLVVLGIAFAFVLQSHYLGLLLIPTLFIFYVLTIRDLKLTGKWRLESGKFIKNSVLATSLFALLMSPLLFFDMRHNWINLNAMKKFFSERQTTVSARPWSAIPKIPELLNQINTSLVGSANMSAGKVVSSIIIILAIWVLWTWYKKRKTDQLFNNLPILIVWLSFALIGFGIYKQNIYDHYFGFIFAVPFLFIGVFTSYLLNKNKYTKWLAAFLLGFLVSVNLSHNPLLSTPNNQLNRSRDVAQKIIEEDGNNEFNLAVLAERNYQDGYKYFLLIKKAKVVEIDAQKPETITNQLFVVCEMLPEKCDPTHSARAEVANFGWSKIENKWEVDGVLVYKLVHLK